MDKANALRSCADKCGNIIKPSNQSGYCSQCVRRHKCKLCGHIFLTRLRHWACCECREAYLTFVTQMRAYFPVVREPQTVMDIRVEMYRQMVANGYALFPEKQAS
jgi:hypothetical protein